MNAEAKRGPLESLKLKNHCEMCGHTNRDKGYAPLEPAFDPKSNAKTLCKPCRIGSAELLAEKQKVLLQFVQSIPAICKQVTDGASWADVLEDTRDKAIPTLPISRARFP